MSRLQKGMQVTLVTISLNLALAFIKIFAGIAGNTYALIADGVESVKDVFSSIIVLGGFTIGAKPPDAEHPYGHGKAESLAALFVSLVLCAVAVGIAVQSIEEILHPNAAPAGYTLIVLVGVILVKEGMFRFQIKKGKDLDSLALKADAWDSRSDALTSLAAFIGISLSIFAGGKYICADDWAALLACGLILFNGLKILRSAVNELMDATPESEVEARIREVAGNVDGVVKIEKCRVRQSGADLLLEIHIEVDGNMRVREGHEIAHQVKDALKNSELNIIDAAVHVEPAGL